jgi:hypothetical protein
MPLFALSTTVDPKAQTLRTLRVLISFWLSDSDPDVVYGCLVGYVGGGNQGFGGFKLIRSSGTFYFKQFCDGTAEEHEDDGWDHVSSHASDSWSKADELALGGMEEGMVFDEFDADGPEDDDFDAFIGGGTVFLPSTLKSMTAGYGDGHFYTWQGERDDKVLEELSPHWPLLTRITDGSAPTPP